MPQRLFCVHKAPPFAFSGVFQVFRLVHTFCPNLKGLCIQVYAAPILFERNAYNVPVFTRIHDYMWSGAYKAAGSLHLCADYLLACLLLAQAILLRS